jgi:hypothetical protein
MNLLAPVKAWTLKRALLVLGPLVTGVVAAALLVWSASADRTGVERSIRTHDAALIDHEARLRAMEHSIPQIANDVRWIRETLEKRPGK